MADMCNIILDIFGMLPSAGVAAWTILASSRDSSQVAPV